MFDDRGYPDPQDDWEDMLPSVDKFGLVVRRRKHPARSVTDIDPDFNVHYEEALHGQRLRDELKLDHLPTDQRDAVRDVVKEYWCVFDKHGLTKACKDYKCVIDTGDNPPVACKNVQYGPLETPEMEKHIATLLSLGHIKQVWDGPWLSKALLAAKPHQEDVRDLDDFVWRFCVNYIPLNARTKTVAFPIPRCDSAVGLGFGGSKWRWLMDAPSGFNQLAVDESSQPKLAFAGPNATKYTYLVMPFGPVNGPVTFIIFIHDMDQTWKAHAKTRGIVIDKKTNTRIIVDDIFSWAPSFELALAYLRCQLEVCRSQNLSLSLPLASGNTFSDTAKHIHPLSD